MAQADYIPAGRTSRIVGGSTEIQIQTEYAQRPNPRLTTSIFSKGQVIHKVEQELHTAISSFDDKIRIEEMLRKQHFEILKTLKDEKKLKPILNNVAPAPGGGHAKRCLSEIKGVERVFQIDNEGNFSSDEVSKEFRNKYSIISKSMLEVLNIFRMLPGGIREKGVYEVEPGRLYLVSCGDECYFLLTRAVDENIDFEEEIRKVIITTCH